MTDEETTYNLGFILEGAGEYQSFTSLVSKIINRQPDNIPRINAGGFGGIVKKEKLHRNLSDITILYKLKTIIVCVDLVDVIKAGLCTSCEDLKNKIDSNIAEWVKAASSDERIKSIPRIVLVIQIQKLETWMVSDVRPLIEKGIFGEVDQLNNVDDLMNPSKFISDNTLVEFDSKNPRFVKSVFSSLDPLRMRLNSKSFNKLAREIESAFT